jgi:hypothetical protein
MSMATLRREWVSVEQAQKWIETYDPQWMSEQVKDATVKELQTGQKRRWFNAIIVDEHTDTCHDGLMQLVEIVQGQRGQRCWIARADDFHFSAAHLERTAQGYELVTRKMDTVEIIPLTIIDASDWPEHRR